QQEERIKALQATIEKFKERQTIQFAQTQGWKTARYLEAVWKLRQGSDRSPETPAQEEGLHSTVLRNWARYLDTPKKDHPYLEDWIQLRRNATMEEVKAVAEKFQAVVISVLIEKEEIDEKNHALELAAEPKTDAFTTYLPNGERADARCKFCEVVFHRF